ncbi:MAG: hypothetical protein D4R79_06485 [Comamonadaceae bacterium]|nr:MAG: hypothetical protein D4R79_06485 [Comamonadaceae bacterium]
MNNDFKRKLNALNNSPTATSTDENALFAWLIEHDAVPVLNKALTRCAPMIPVYGVEKNKPSHWVSPAPAGTGNQIGIVIGLDDKGALRCSATNMLKQPAKTEAPCPAKFFEKFDALKSTAEQTKLIGTVIDSAACNGHLDEVERVSAEGQRYRTMPINLVVMDGDKQHFFCTTALVEGPQQIDSKLQWAGKVK